MSEYAEPRHISGQTSVKEALQNLSTLHSRMDSLQRFLSEAIHQNTLLPQSHMNTISSEITSAIHQIIINGAALLLDESTLAISPERQPISLTKSKDDLISSDPEEIVEIDAVELLEEHAHLCDVCGKGFKRDANLRMHMRAHGNQFKTAEALAKPLATVGSEEDEKISGATRFSCPFKGCNRNKLHGKFRALKSVICVRNHFKRRHCPKMYTCHRCNKKSFSVLADLKGHLRHCGELKWRCSCGTSFSRKDKLFGHIGLFDGHMPAPLVDEVPSAEYVNWSDTDFFEGLLKEFGEEFSDAGLDF